MIDFEPLNTSYDETAVCNAIWCCINGILCIPDENP